jgi:hypothetical protein
VPPRHSDTDPLPLISISRRPGQGQPGRAVDAIETRRRALTSPADLMVTAAEPGLGLGTDCPRASLTV